MVPHHGDFLLTARIYIGNADGDREDSLRTAFDYIGVHSEIGRSTKVFVKPNFTFPRPVPGVTTSREVLQDTLRLLAETGAEVFVGESNGGYGSFIAKEAFEGHGLYEICRLTRTEPIDLSALDKERYFDTIGGKRVSVCLPKFLVDEVDFTLSVPVMKVHAMTTVSLSMKNLWGCYPTDLRLLEHEEIERKLALIHRLVKARFGIIDASYALDRHGPMQGDARAIGKFIAGNNLLALDIACTRMMGFNPRRVRHLNNLVRFTSSSATDLTVESNEDLGSYDWGFTLYRDLIDGLSLACFHSDLLAKIVFDSPLTQPIYAMVGRKPRRRLA